MGGAARARARDRFRCDRAAPAGDAEARSLKSQLSGLVEDVRVLAYAEVEYYRTKLSVNMAATKRIVTLAGIGIIFAAMAVITLILGILLILADYVGPVAATAIVTGVTLLVAATTISVAIKQAKRLPLDETDA